MDLKSKIVLGNYIPKDSVIHRIDSRIKFLFLLSLLFSLNLINNLNMSLIPLGITLICLQRARLPISSIFKTLLPFVWLFLLTGLLNLFFTPGEFISGTNSFGITLEGISSSALLILKLIIMILLASLFTFTTSPREIIVSIGWFLKPFRKLGFPVHEFSLMVSLSVRFIPILLEEADRTFKALSLKGAYLGSYSKRIKTVSLFLSPLFTNTFRRAEEITTAMILKGYEKYKTYS